MESWLKAALRERCIQLAIYLHHGQLPAELLGEVVELCRDAWAFRDEEDA